MVNEIGLIKSYIFTWVNSIFEPVRIYLYLRACLSVKHKVLSTFDVYGAHPVFGLCQQYDDNDTSEPRPANTDMALRKMLYHH